MWTETMVATIGLAAVIGVSLGSLGSGGSILLMPVLVYIGGYDVRTAIIMSLVVVGASGAVGAAVQWRRGRVHARAVGLFASTGVVGAYAGSLLTHLVPERVLLLVFAAIMLAVGAAMLRPMRKPTGAVVCKPARCLVIGGCVGVLTGFLGVGGGFLIVPALVLFGGLEITLATGTSLAVIGINSAIGLAGHAGQADLDWAATAWIVAAVLVGMLAGVSLGARIPAAWLRRVFAIVVLGVALWVAVQGVKGDDGGESAGVRGTPVGDIMASR